MGQLVNFQEGTWPAIQRLAVVRGEDEMRTLAHAVGLEQAFCEKVILGGGKMNITMPDGTIWNYRTPEEMRDGA